MQLTELTQRVEAVSHVYAERHGFDRDETWFLLKLQEEVGELTQAFLQRAGQARGKGRTPEQLEAGFRAELADVLAHTLLLARHCGVDLQCELEAKWLWRVPEPKAVTDTPARRRHTAPHDEDGGVC